MVAETKVMALLGQQEMRSRQYPEALVSSSGLFGRLLNTGLWDFFFCPDFRDYCGFASREAVQLKRDEEGGVSRWIWEPVVAGRLSSSGLHFKVLQWSRAVLDWDLGAWGISFREFLLQDCIWRHGAGWRKVFFFTALEFESSCFELSYISGLLEEITMVYRLGIMMRLPFTQGSLWAS